MFVSLHRIPLFFSFGGMHSASLEVLEHSFSFFELVSKLGHGRMKTIKLRVVVSPPDRFPLQGLSLFRCFVAVCTMSEV